MMLETLEFPTKKLCQVYEDFLYNLLGTFRDYNHLDNPGYFTEEMELEVAQHIKNEEYDKAITLLLTYTLPFDKQVEFYQKCLKYEN